MISIPLGQVRAPENWLYASTSTLYSGHWEPNISTDQEGKAIVSFHTADLPGQYRITVEGTDMNGHLGSSCQKLSIRP